jgi:hypothetical protein
MTGLDHFEFAGFLSHLVTHHCFDLQSGQLMLVVTVELSPFPGCVGTGCVGKAWLSFSCPFF